jgi:hypothetical protein
VNLIIEIIAESTIQGLLTICHFWSFPDYSLFSIIRKHLIRLGAEETITRRACCSSRHGTILLLPLLWHQMTPGLDVLGFGVCCSLILHDGGGLITVSSAEAH